MNTQEQKTILLVEDEIIVALAEAQTIALFGYKVLTANSGEDGVQIALHDETISLILMDIDLGKGINGPEAARQILEKRTLPIVFVASHGEREMVEKMRGITRYGCVIKNSGDFVLQSSIEMALDLFDANQKTKRELMNRIQAEDLLWQRESFIRSVMDNLPIGIAVNSVDPAIKFTYMNDNFPRFYRTTREVLAVPDVFWTAVYEEPDFREAMKKRVLDDCASGDLRRMHWADIPITRKGEETTFVTSMNAPLPDKQLMISLVWDVTGRKRAEEELRESQDILKSTIESPQEVNIVSINKNYEYLSFNALHKFSRKQAYGIDVKKGMNTLDSILNKDERMKVKVFFDIAFAGESCSSMEQYGTIDPVYWETKYSPMVNNKKEIIGATAFSINITVRKRAEQALRESEEKHRTILQTAMDGFWLMDMQGCLLEVNGAYCRMSGYSKRELLATRISDLEVNERAIDIAARIQKIMAQGEDRFESRHRRKDGSCFDVEVSVQYRATDRGLFVAFLRDITGRKRAEEALLSERRRLENIIEGTQVGTWEWNVQTGETVFNDMWAHILGYELDELAPISIKTWESLTHPGDLKASGELLERHFAGELPYYDCECRMRHKDGHWVWVRDRGKLVSWTVDGKPSMVFGTHQDITERKVAEKALMLTRMSVESASDALFWMTPGARIVDVNDAACRSLGYSREELLQLSVPDVDTHYDAENWRQHFPELRKRGTLRFVSEHRAKDGRLIPVEIAANYVRFGDEEFNCAFVRGITGREQAEEAVR
jgi:PAS domain S-box-containing protein